MVIKRMVQDQGHPERTNEVTVPSFTFAPNEGLALLIIDAWGDAALRKKLLERDAHGNPTPSAVEEATKRVNSQGGFDLKRAVVISEKEHDNHYTMKQGNEVVFVLPNNDRIDPAASGASLLNTARLLMACTPNGI